MNSLRTSRRAARAALLLGTALLGACAGDNAFSGPGGGGGGGGGNGQQNPDTQPPTVVIQAPADSAAVAVGDSVLIRARATDAARLDSVIFEGFALRGDPNLGTQQPVARYAKKTVNLRATGRVITDTIVSRFLLATADSTPERAVLLVATAVDTAGNIDADTVAVNIGGPRVEILAPTPTTPLAAGQNLSVRVRADDPSDLVSSVRVFTTGALARDTTLTLQVAAAAVDTIVVIPIPTTTQGAVRINATVVSGARLTGQARPIDVTVSAPAPDVTAPRVSFQLAVPTRVERNDTVRVNVQATDETRVDSVGATLLVIRRGAAREDTIGRFTMRSASAADSLKFPLEQLSLDGRDTVNLTLEVTAWALDGARNCGAAVTPNTPQSLPCRVAGGVRLSDVAGRLVNVLVARGATVSLSVPTDRLADLASDGARVFASNFSRNRVEVLPVQGTAFGTPIRVGSQPWGLAMGRNNDELFVANSGSTTISRVPVGAALPTEEDPSDRIETPNVRLFVVRFSVDQAGLTRLQIQALDYSDRPQFIGQTADGRLLYSTKPTSAATPGTLREFRPSNPELGVRLFADYAFGPQTGIFVVREATSVSKYTYGGADESTDQLVVCDRRPGDAADTCFPGAFGDTASFQTIQQRLLAGGFDAVLDFNLNPDLIPLTDTTFVAVSRDRRTVAFGEGAAQFGRIIAYRETPGGSTVGVGDTEDLVNNAAERVVGLALNPDGTLGAARGNDAYLFNRDLRLAGTIETGAPAGGITMHPNHNAADPLRRLAFITGEENGVPFIDIVDTFFSASRRRIVIRERVTGALIAVLPRPGDPADLAMRLYGITASGVVAVDVYNADLQP